MNRRNDKEIANHFSMAASMWSSIGKEREREINILLNYPTQYFFFSFLFFLKWGEFLISPVSLILGVVKANLRHLSLEKRSNVY